MIGVFAQIIVDGVVHILRMGAAHTGTGGVRFSFRARLDAAWYQIIFVGDQTATAVVNHYILKHTD